MIRNRDIQKSESSDRFVSYMYLIVLRKVLLFCDVVFFELPYRSISARAVSFNLEIAGSFRFKTARA